MVPKAKFFQLNSRPKSELIAVIKAKEDTIFVLEPRCPYVKYTPGPTFGTTAKLPKENLYL